MPPFTLASDRSCFLAPSLREGLKPTGRTAAASSALTLAAVLAVAGLAAAGCGGAAQAPPAAQTAPAAASTTATVPSPSEAPTLAPEQRDPAFVDALNSKGLQAGDPQTRTAVAQSICQSLDSGVTVPALAGQLQEALGGATQENTGFIIGAATAIYCPNNLPKLRNS